MSTFHLPGVKKKIQFDKDFWKKKETWQNDSNLKLPTFERAFDSFVIRTVSWSCLLLWDSKVTSWSWISQPWEPGGILSSCSSRTCNLWCSSALFYRKHHAKKPWSHYETWHLDLRCLRRCTSEVIISDTWIGWSLSDRATGMLAFSSFISSSSFSTWVDKMAFSWAEVQRCF